MTRIFWHCAIYLIFCIALPVHAQQFGIAGILNPEGSRLFPQTVVYPRHPGKPDPRWKAFEWRYLDVAIPVDTGTPLSTDAKKPTANMRLYFYKGEEWSAQFTLPRIRAQVERLSRIFNYVPEKQFSYLLFTSLYEFRQANIFFITEGVQGVTSTTEATMAIPYEGRLDTFDHVSPHEMVHQFQVQKVNSIAGAGSLLALGQVPLWFIEGMAEYYSLEGIDNETRMYMRDLILHPDEERDHKIPDLFAEGPLNFIHVYKLGQARIDFFEKEFGEGTAQKLLSAAAAKLAPQRGLFKDLVVAETGVPLPELEKRWRDYVDRTYKTNSELLSQKLESYEQVEEAGETLDFFKISPDGKLLALREINELTGITSIKLTSFDRMADKITVAENNKPGLLSLFFLQLPSVALSNNLIAYAVQTIDGPEIEFREIERDEDELDLEGTERIRLKELDIVQASGLTISPDEKKIAFAGLDSKGWLNVYVAILEDDGDFTVKKLTDDYYSWGTLEWTKDGILGISNKTASAESAVFLIDPATGSSKQLTTASKDQRSPAGRARDFVYQSWLTGSSQLHHFQNGKVRVLTNAKTGLFYPQRRGDELYALGFRSGRYHLYRIGPKSTLSETPPMSDPIDAPAWRANFAALPAEQVQDYKPFKSSGIRLDNLIAFFGTGSAGGVAAAASDMMRNYGVYGEFFFFGDLDSTNASTFITSSKGRTTWITGAYHTVQPRVDAVFMTDDETVRTYLHREFGGLGALQYPLGPFTYFDAELRFAGVRRTEYSDPVLAGDFGAVNPGLEFLLAPMFRFGYDRVLYELFSGPIEGYGLLAESDTSFFPARNSVSQRFRLDAAYYLRPFGRTVFALQGLGGAAFAGLFRNPFFISSDDILRAYPFGDDRLFGNYVLAAKSELRFPIGDLFGFPPLRGLAAYDYGTVFNQKRNIDRNITSSYSAGVSLNLPPLALSFIWSKPLQTAPGPEDSTVFHFLFRYLYL